MSGWFRRFFLGDFGPPPPPDLAEVPSFTDQSLVETIYADCQSRRAFITVDETGDYQIYVQSWDTSDWKAGHGARWSHLRGTGCHTDMLPRARELAGEALGAFTG